MKAKLFIIGLFLFALAACVKVPEPAVAEHGRSVEGPSPELCAIDSLLWRQPDSALACLLPYFDTCIDTKFCVSTATAYNRHYAHLLLSELLYKNDYPQTNRTEMLQAVAYFDSLVVVDGADTRGVSLQARPRRDARRASTQNIAFLDARAHYINGVGYYENDSMVEACEEYLKALEVMENHFEEKELIGRKAQFMSYIYNRIGDLFQEQLLAEPAVICYKQALKYCKIKQTSLYGISVLFYYIGIQFDISGQADSAGFYYDEALANMPDYDNLHYRDIITSKALLAYNNGLCMDTVIKDLYNMFSLAADESERTTRCLTIGHILFEDKQYDSSKFYLQTVFEQQEDNQIKIAAAEYLSEIYRLEGDSVKASQYSSFLANYTVNEIEKKADVSRINERFKNYMAQKQEKQAEEDREKAIKRVIKIIIPIAVVIAMAVFVMTKFRGKRQLRDKEKHHQLEMENERQAHRMQQAALSGRLKRSNEELRDVSKQLEQMLAKDISSSIELSNDYNAFVNTPICLYIVGLVHKQQYKSKMDHLVYKDDALSKEQLLDLRDAAETNLTRFVSYIRKQFSKLTDSDIDYCYLFLLGLNEADVSALMQRAYTTVCDRSRKISRIIGANESLYHTLRNMLSE